MKFGRRLIERLVMSVAILILVPSIAFVMESISPGNLGLEILGPTATPAEVQRINAQFGLNLPIYEQYWHWLRDALTGNLGTSYTTGSKVLTVIGQRWEVTFFLVLGATLFASVLGIGFGILSARRGRVVRRTTDVVSIFGLAVPNYWLGIVLALAFAVKFRVFPATGYVSPTVSVLGWIKSLVLPVVALGLGLATLIAKQTRDQVLAAQDLPFIRTLRANGVPERKILFKHVFRNAAIPVVTVISLSFVASLSGSVLVETVFAMPGLSSALVSAAEVKDLPTLEGISVYYTLLAVAVLLCMDIAHGILDPRTRVQG